MSIAPETEALIRRGLRLVHCSKASRMSREFVEIAHQIGPVMLAKEHEAEVNAILEDESAQIRADEEEIAKQK